MFGLILEGWTKDFLNLEEELMGKRMKICESCSLYTENKFLGPVCDAGKCEGGICGCGCALKKKSRIQNAKCVLGKW